MDVLFFINRSKKGCIVVNVILLEGEEIIKEGKCFIYNLLNKKPGKLILTDRRLIFASPGLDFDRDNLTFNLRDIVELEGFITFILAKPIPLKNGLKIATTNGKSYKFIVSDKEAWMKALQSRINNSENEKHPHIFFKGSKLIPKNFKLNRNK